jgi:hypothetical protein
MKELVLNKLKGLGVKYKESGKHYVMVNCLNPNHDDKNASCSINTSNGFGRCFTCGFPITPKYFTDGLSEAQVLELERKAKFEKLKNTITKSSTKRSKILMPPKSDEELPNIWRGVSKSILQEVGAYICRIGQYHDRIIFPINEYSFTSRKLLDDSNYKSGTGKWLHSKGFKHYDDTYILSRGGDSIILTEGLHDALLLYQDGYSVICNFGVAPNILNSNILAKLLSANISTVYVMFDNDKAGQGATTNLFNRYLEAHYDTLITIKHARLVSSLKEYYNSNCKDYGEYKELHE